MTMNICHHDNESHDKMKQVNDSVISLNLIRSVVVYSNIFVKSDAENGKIHLSSFTGIYKMIVVTCLASHRHTE